MEEKRLLEEMCDLVFEKAQPKSEEYRKKLAAAVEARSRLEEALNGEQKQLLEERDDALNRCTADERLLMFKETLRLAFEIFKGMEEDR